MKEYNSDKAAKHNLQPCGRRRQNIQQNDN
jgi:hypothetical protein